MYNPQRFKSDDIKEVFDLMDQNPFATVVTVVDGRPFVSHLPLTPQMIGNKIELIGHFARANPHCKSLTDAQTVVIFHGPQTYITPRWYAESDVPTWNYSTVHVTGKIELIERYEGIVECLQDLTAHVERHWPSGWEFLTPDHFKGDILTQSIVGFRIKVEEIQFKKKLSQNRTAADRAGVLKGLQTRGDDNSRSVLKEMKKLYSLTGESK